MDKQKESDEIMKFLTKENLDFIQEYEFKEEDYNEILDNIYHNATSGLCLDDSLTVLEKVRNIAYQFTEILPEYDKKLQGCYIYNKIYLDEELSDAKKITTIIHELSHHLFAQIYIQWLKRIFDADDKVIESFVMFMLNNSIEDLAANEYISYIIEARFTPPECQNYIPFLQLLISYQIDVEKSKDYFIFAHEISHDLQDVLDKVIDSKLKDEIREQFKKDNIEEINQELKFDYRDIRFNTQEKLEIMKEMIMFIMDYFVNDNGSINQLIEYYDGFV